MALAIKSNQSYVHRLESGQATCSADMLAAIKKFLEIEDVPLMEHELMIYWDKIWIWNDQINANRLDDARATHLALSPIKQLPFEKNLYMLYSLLEIALTIKSANLAESVARLSSLQHLLTGASNEVLFVYNRTCGHLHLMSGDYKASIQHYQKASEIECRDVKPDAAFFANLGVAYMNIGKPNYATQYLERGHQESLQGDRSHPVRAHSTSMLATAYVNIGEYKKAEKLFNMALASARSVGDEKIMILTLSNYSVLKIKMGDYEEGLRLCNQAFATDLSQDFSSSMTLINDKYGNALLLTLLYNKALGFLKMKAFDRCKEILDYGFSIVQGNNKFAIGFESLKHRMTLHENESIEYLETKAIPYFRHGDGLDTFVALDICNDMEAYFKKKKLKIKTFTIVGIIRDIYDTMFFGEI